MNLTYWWNFGVLSLYFLIIQLITGIFLAMFYDPSILYAFSSIMYINNEIYYGWWIRGLHANGASFFFLSVYLHMFRGLYYGSFLYPRQLLWKTGVILFLLMIITAFLGYVLPWGQMSFRGAMVITSLLSAIPLVGNDIVFLLWGGFTIDDATLHRFYSLHFFLPFIILALSIVHISLLHEAGSSNPTGVPSMLEVIPFTPYFILKDILSILIFLIIIMYLNYSAPDILGHTLNYQIANFLVTPPHIVPEWYLLFFYAILRSIPGKLSGFLIMVISIIILIFLPYIMKNAIIRSGTFRPAHKIFFWIFVFNCILLGWIGGIPVMEPYLTIGRFLSFLYFFFLLVLFPLAIFIDRTIYDAYNLNNK
ncbi:MAG TPA: cytochrome b N-terminal domain-containing protein [Mycoplasmatales bacterium]|nr:cytochrome b N-terminal domain-containing protein [Mycoplasmatales bacterium]